MPNNPTDTAAYIQASEREINAALRDVKVAYKKLTTMPPKDVYRREALHALTLAEGRLSAQSERNQAALRMLDARERG